MAIKFQNPCFISSRPPRIHFLVHKIVHLNHLLNAHPRHKCRMRNFLWEYGRHNQHSMWVELSECCPNVSKARRWGWLAPLASADEGVTVNGIPQASSGSDMEEMRVKFDQSLQGQDYSDGLIQSLHDAARVFELAIKERNSVSKISWFSIAWLPADKNAWLKPLSYQVGLADLFKAYCTAFHGINGLP